MTYIIKPGLFYWMQVLDALKMLAVGMAITLAFVVAAILIYFAVMKIDEGYHLDCMKPLKKFAVIMCFAIFVFTAAAVFLPDKQTMAEMLIARMATAENTEWTVEALKSAVDYIVQAMQSVR